MIVRLKARIRAGSRVVPHSFNSMIVRLKASPPHTEKNDLTGFQFYDSPIKRSLEI